MYHGLFGEFRIRRRHRSVTPLNSSSISPIRIHVKIRWFIFTPWIRIRGNVLPQGSGRDPATAPVRYTVKVSKPFHYRSGFSSKTFFKPTCPDSSVEDPGLYGDPDPDPEKSGFKIILKFSERRHFFKSVICSKFCSY